MNSSPFVSMRLWAFVLLVLVIAIADATKLYGISNRGCLTKLELTGATRNVQCYGQDLVLYPPSSAASDKLNSIYYITTPIGQLYGLSLTASAKGVVSNKTFSHERLQGLRYDPMGRKIILKQFYNSSSDFAFDITEYNSTTQVAQNIVKSRSTSFAPCTSNSSPCTLLAAFDPYNRTYYIPETHDDDDGLVKQILAVKLSNKKTKMITVYDDQDEFVELRNLVYNRELHYLYTVATFQSATDNTTFQDLAIIDPTSGKLTRQGIFNSPSLYLLSSTLYDSTMFILTGSLNWTNLQIHTVDVSTLPSKLKTSANMTEKIYNIQAYPDDPSVEEHWEYVDDEITSSTEDDDSSWSSEADSSDLWEEDKSLILLIVLLVAAVVAAALAGGFLYYRWRTRRPAYLN